VTQLSYQVTVSQRCRQYQTLEGSLANMKGSLCREKRVQMRTNELDFLTKIIVHAHTQHGGDKVK